MNDPQGKEEPIEPDSGEGATEPATPPEDAPPEPSTSDTPPPPPEEEAPPIDADAEPYDADSETGPVFDAPEPGGDRSLHAGCHLITLIWILGVPGIHAVAPLALWYFAKRDDEEVERHAKEAFNFQVNALIWSFSGFLMIATCLLAPIGLVIMATSIVMGAALPIVAAVRISNGEDYRYPFTYRFLD